MKKRKKVKHKKLPDLEFLLENYDYNPITGILSKKDEYGIDEPKPVGWIDEQGYCRVSIKSSIYQVHRIVFYMYHRRDPGKKVIDHIDGNKSNNQIFNLRACSHRQNIQNTQRRRDEGIVPKAEYGCHLALA